VPLVRVPFTAPAHASEELEHPLKIESRLVSPPAAAIGRGSKQDNVDTPHLTPSLAKAAAITELFAALETLLASYKSVPDDEREDRLAADADLITGEIARRLAVARARASHPSPPSRRPDGPGAADST
jgi:hypothetical protein